MTVFPSSIAALGLTLPLWLLAAIGQQPASLPPQPTAALALPEGPGRSLVERACGGCHDPSLVMFTREDEEGWGVIVQDMAARGTTATEEELKTITTYLATHFSRDRGFSPLLRGGARAAVDEADPAQRFAAGREIYQSLCLGCHQADGRGRQNVAPSLVGSELTLAPAGIPIRIMLHGKRGQANVMPALGPLLGDDQIAATLTYIRGEWGNAASPIDTGAVKEVRAATTGRARPWTEEELRKAAADKPGASSRD